MKRSGIYFLLCLAAASSLSVSDDLTTTPVPEPVTRCTAPGSLVCDLDCSDLVVCLGDGADGFREESVESCDALADPPTHCYSPSKRCETRSTCNPTTDVDFECTTSGQLPHPTECTKFYVCVPDSDEPTGFKAHLQTCDPGYAYNSSRGFCNLPLTHPTCQNGPVPQCNEVGAIGSLPENTSIYYVCKRRGAGGDLVPVLFVCKHGGIFVEETATCVLTKKKQVEV